MSRAKLTFLEFFAGGGMARAGLGPGWTCLFANDFDPDKAASYRANWGGGHFHEGDLAAVPLQCLGGEADLAWASFPCQDLSLAGAGKGMGAQADEVRTRSGAFWLFHEKMRALREAGRSPRAIVLENVLGVLTSHGRADFCAVIAALDDLGYRAGALVIDARWFTPQSRPRVFFVALRKDIPVSPEQVAGAGESMWSNAALAAAIDHLPAQLAKNFVRWRLPAPARRNTQLIDIIEEAPADAPWRAPEATQRLLGLMAPAHRDRIRDMQRDGHRAIGAVFRRTRPDGGGKAQRAEIRFDGMAGCLRTPGGGSSRQIIVEVEGARIRSRLLSARESARLMGLPDSYILPEKASKAQKLCGDGLCVPVIRHLANFLLEPLLTAPKKVLAAE